MSDDRKALVERLRERTLPDHGGSGDWDSVTRHHWGLVPLDSALHAEAIAEIERLAESQNLMDASRYRFLRNKVCGIGGKGFDFVNLPPMPESWAKGSIAEHFDVAIDDALASGTRRSDVE